MKTVKQLIEELKKFPLDANCFAYEGEVIGIAVNKDDKQGVIFCSECNDTEKTELL